MKSSIVFGDEENELLYRKDPQPELTKKAVANEAPVASEEEEEEEKEGAAAAAERPSLTIDTLAGDMARAGLSSAEVSNKSEATRRQLHRMYSLSTHLLYVKCSRLCAYIVSCLSFPEHSSPNAK
jgi:hypothetical protein